MNLSNKENSDRNLMSGIMSSNKKQQRALKYSNMVRACAREMMSQQSFWVCVVIKT